MRSLTPLIRLAVFGTGVAVCLVAASPLRADEAATGKAAPAATSSEAQKPAQGDSVEKQLQEEVSKLQKLEAELKAIESTPLPDAPSAAAKPQAEKPAPNPNDVPKEPVKGLEEEFADAHYALGKYDSARAVYQKIIESKPRPDVLAWARLQVGNCARRSGDLQAAITAYEELMNASPGSPWAPEAAWWAGELKWWRLWDATVK